MKSILISLTLVTSIWLVNQNVWAQITPVRIYQCAPCGCEHDGQHFHKPGNCPSCGMRLEAVEEPYGALKNLEKPLNVAILIYPHAQVLDYAGPYDVFQSGGKNFNVYTVGETSDKITTMPNLSINPEYSIENAPAPDVLIIPGGMWQTVGDNTKEWITRSADEADHIFSVCTGAFLLADMGLLDGKEATTHNAGIDLLKKNYPAIKEVKEGVRYVDNGKIITSAGVSAGIDASFYLVEKILGKEWAEAVSRNLEYPYSQK